MKSVGTVQAPRSNSMLSNCVLSQRQRPHATEQICLSPIPFNGDSSDCCLLQAHQCTGWCQPRSYGISQPVDCLRWSQLTSSPTQHYIWADSTLHLVSVLWFTVGYRRIYQAEPNQMECHLDVRQYKARSWPHYCFIYIYIYIPANIYNFGVINDFFKQITPIWS